MDTITNRRREEMLRFKDWLKLQRQGQATQPGDRGKTT